MSFVACVFCGVPAKPGQEDAVCPECGGEFLEFEGIDDDEDITEAFLEEEELEEEEEVVDEDQYVMFEGYNWNEWN